MGGSSAFGSSRSVGSSISAGSRSLIGGSSGMGGGMGGGMNMGANGQNMLNQMNQNAGQLTSSDRFLRSNRRPGQFVGSDSQDSQNFMSALGNASQLRAAQSNMRANTQVRQPQQNRQGQAAGAILPRMRLELGFDKVEASATTRGDVLEKRFEGMPALKTQSPIQVAVQGETATLTGVVATEHARLVAAQLALLEPGISRVQNDLQVAMPSPHSTQPASPAAR